MNRLTRTPSACASSISGRSRSPSAARSQPWSEVNWPSPSGTNVHCCGRVLAHETHQVLEGVAFDVVLGLRPVAASARRARARRAARMWRSSGRGCTVMPSAPASRHSVAARRTLGMPRCRVLRSSATLLTLTDSAVARLARRRWAVAISGFMRSACRGAAALSITWRVRSGDGAADDSEAAPRSGRCSAAQCRAQASRSAARACPMARQRQRGRDAIQSRRRRPCRACAVGARRLRPAARSAPRRQRLLVSVAHDRSGSSPVSRSSSSSKARSAGFARRGRRHGQRAQRLGIGIEQRRVRILARQQLAAAAR